MSYYVFKGLVEIDYNLFAEYFFSDVFYIFFIATVYVSYYM